MPMTGPAAAAAATAATAAAPRLSGDWQSVGILLLLYTLQGIPMVRAILPLVACARCLLLLLPPLSTAARGDGGDGECMTVWAAQGLAAALGLSLKMRGASYADMATLSFMSWPYSLKLLWAPVVDALWVRQRPRAHALQHGEMADPAVRAAKVVGGASAAHDWLRSALCGACSRGD